MYVVMVSVWFPMCKKFRASIITYALLEEDMKVGDPPDSFGYGDQKLFVWILCHQSCFLGYMGSIDKLDP